MSFKAIDTHYKGYRFRSRLEARWAVFLDHMQCKWQYEPQGFNLDGMLYLPDFWLPFANPDHAGGYEQGSPPEKGYWLEIKPLALSERECELCRKLAENTRHVVKALAGNVGLGEFTSYLFNPRGYVQKTYAYRHHEFRTLQHLFHDEPFIFYLCTQCSAAEYYEYERLIRGGFKAARSIRFEHGERH